VFERLNFQTQLSLLSDSWQSRSLQSEQNDVEGLDKLLAQMKATGIMPVVSVQKTSYGNFVHLMDPEGNKIKLWEPNDVEFAKMGNITTK